MAVKFVEHKADVLFKASASSFPKALEEAASAMFGTIAKTRSLKESRKVKIKAHAFGLNALVVGVLTELLIQQEAQEVFWKRFKVSKFEGSKGSFKIEGVAYGSPYNPKLGLTDVKAVTYHELKVEEKKGKCTITVFPDV